MLYLGLIVLLLLNTVWLALVAFGLPGNWFMVVTTSLFAWWCWEDRVFSIYTLLGVVILAFVGELLEFLGGIAGAKKAGAGIGSLLGIFIAAVTGAIIGSVIIPIPIFGAVAGSSIGAGLGALVLGLTGGKRLRQSVHQGFGAGLGQLLGISAKILVGGLIWLIVAVAAFWP